MDGRTKRGVFVALRRSGDPRVAVLKLDVVSEHAGFLADAGDIDVIDNLLDIPGELQKGAVTPDPRPNSTVIVGDKLGDTSQYFLDALDISQLQKPTAAVADMARVLHQELPADKADNVIARLPGSEAPTVEAFLESASDVLTDREQAKIASVLTDKARPARYLDARRASVRKVIRGDGITISGTVRDMNRVKLEPLHGTDRWRLEVVFDSKPETRF
jgi:hypothetical protein